MAEMTFKETCPCGDSVEIGGWQGPVERQIATWHSIHKPHMNKIAKAIEEAKLRPVAAPVVPSAWWPYNPPKWPQDYGVTFETDMTTGITTQRNTT